MFAFIYSCGVGARSPLTADRLTESVDAAQADDHRKASAAMMKPAERQLGAEMVSSGAMMFE
jgi:hypothetical protein